MLKFLYRRAIKPRKGVARTPVELLLRYPATHPEGHDQGLCRPPPGREGLGEGNGPPPRGNLFNVLLYVFYVGVPPAIYIRKGPGPKAQIRAVVPIVNIVKALLVGSGPATFQGKIGYLIMSISSPGKKGQGLLKHLMLEVFICPSQSPGTNVHANGSTSFYGKAISRDMLRA